MIGGWPFLDSTLRLIEIALAEAEPEIAEAYAAQEAYYRLAEPTYGAVAGAKIATTMIASRIKLGMSGNPSDRTKARRDGSARAVDTERGLLAAVLIGFSGGR